MKMWSVKLDVWDLGGPLDSTNASVLPHWQVGSFLY